MAAVPPVQFPGFARSAVLRILAKWPRFRRGRNSGHDYDLVILKLDHIGDFILATGAIRFALSKTKGKTLLIISDPAVLIAQRLFPEADILGLPAFAPSLLRDLLPLARKWGARLRSVRCKTLLHLRYQPGDYHRLIQKWIDADQEFAMEAEGYPVWREGLILPLRSDVSLRYPKPTEPYGDSAEKLVACAEIEAHRQICESWTGESVSLKNVWPSLGPIVQEAVFPLASNALLVAPFTTKLVREIRPDQLIEALRIFQDTTSLPILIACAPDEHTRGEALVNYAERCGIQEIRLMPPQHLPDYIATVSSCRMVLSMDSATAHIAAAAGVPGVALLGGGHFGCFAPWSKNDSFTWLSHSLPCFHCEWICHRPENECLSFIRPGKIADALLAQFESIHPASKSRPDAAGLNH